jgi:hypothetical protein
MSEDVKYASRVTGQGVRAGKYHLYRDCSVINHTGRTEGTGLEVVELTDRDVDLLGMSECSQCRKRRTGGPAIEALKEVTIEHSWSHPDGVDEFAWKIFNGLKERGFYIASRRNNQEVKAVKDVATS